MGYSLTNDIDHGLERTPLRRSPSFLRRLPGYSGQVSGQAPVPLVRPTLLRSAISSGPETHIWVFQLQERGQRFNNPETGRWLSRDPLSEDYGWRLKYGDKDIPVRIAYYPESLFALYGFLSNDPVNQGDGLGLASFNGRSNRAGFSYQLSVEECEIAIFYGHGAPGAPHDIDFEGDRCSRGVFFGCGEEDTNIRIPEDRRLFPDDPGESGTREWTDIRNSATGARNTALSAAAGICAQCICDSVSIQYVFLPHNTWRGRLRDASVDFGHLDRPSTGANGQPWPGNETVNCRGLGSLFQAL